MTLSEQIATPEPTLCEDCANVHTDTRKRSPTQWLCVKHRRVAGGSFIAPNFWVETDPFLRCAAVNGGACLLFSPRRDASKEQSDD